MERCAGGGIMRSSVATRYQLGFAFQAGSVTAPASASTPQGTCESAMKAALSGSTSAAKEVGELGAIEEQEAVLRRQDRRHRRARRRVGDQRRDRFARVGREGGDVDQRLHLRIVAGLGDDDAAVGMADQDTGPSCAAIARLVKATSSASEVVGFWTMVTL